MKSECIKAEICKARGGARAIATLTFDDGVRTAALALSELLSEYGLCGSLMTVPTRVMGEPPYSSGYADADDINGFVALGTLEPQSHSYSHLYIAEPGHPDHRPENCTDENREREILGSKKWLEEHFPDVPCVSLAVPGGSYDEKTESLIMKTFYAARRSGLGGVEMQSLTPSDEAVRGGWYRLSSIWLKEERISDIFNYLDKCVEEGGWFIAGCHNLFGAELGRGNYDITPEALRTVLARVREYKACGKIWAASFSEATRYLREYEGSSVSAYCEGGDILVEVTMKNETPRGLPLTADVFNYPLTVRVELPADREGARYLLGGEYQCARVESEGGKTYAYIDIIPNSGAVRVEGEG